MRTLVVDHPLVTHKLTALRDSASDTATFRSLTAELVTLLAYEATREMRVQPVSVTTPVGLASGVKLAGPVPLIVPVLRAGIGMLEGMTRLLPMAEVGFVGLRRDEESLVASTYADRLPTDLTGRDTFVLDPMLATGGTLKTTVSMLVERGAAAVTTRTDGASPGSPVPSSAKTCSTCRKPSGAASRQIAVIEAAPRFASMLMTVASVPPVASMGSSTNVSRPVRSVGSRSA